MSKKMKREIREVFDKKSNRLISYPVMVGHKGKSTRTKTKQCTGCGKEAGILAITLPSNRFLRPRTESESKHIAELEETKNINSGDLWLDRRNRKIRYCPQCIKPIREKLGYDKQGNTIPVSLWGQKR